MAAKTFGRRRVETFVGLAGAVGLLAGCGGGGGSKKSTSASTVAPSTSSVAPTTSSQAPVVLNLASGRALHTATLLKTGEVFVVGGVDAAGAALDQTAILTATTVKVGPRLLAARVGHTATLLENGQILISGGQSDLKSTTPVATTEIFDPLAGSIAQGPKLGAPRSQHIACSFGPVGAQKVLIAGGFDGKAPMDSAELFDVKTSTFSAVKGKLTEATAGANAARLDDGTIVIGGGDGAAGPSGAQVFDPVAGTFTATKITIKRSGGSFAASGREALLAGGQSTTGVERSSEIYDIATKMFTAGPQLANGRRDATASVVAGQVIVIGGRNGTGAMGSVEVLKGGVTFAQASTNPAADLTTARYGHTATALSAGTVMVIGGFDASGNVLASCENYDPNAPIGPSVGTPTTTAPPVIAPPTTTPPTTTTPPAKGGLAGLLGGLLGGGGTGGTSSSLLGKIGSAALTTITTNGFSGGIGGFFKSFLGNLVNQFVPGLVGGGSTASGSTASSGSGGIGGVLGGLLGGLFGGGSGSATTPPSSATAPAIQSMTPGTGKVGDTVKITGYNFGATVSVKFTKKQGFFSKVLGFVTGSKPTVDASVTSVAPSGNATVVTFTVPADSVTGDVKVVTNGATVSAGNFNVQ